MGLLDFDDVSVTGNAMENSGLDETIAAQEPFARGCVTRDNLLSLRDTNVALSKSPKPHIPEGASGDSSRANGELKEQRSKQPVTHRSK